MQITAYFCTQLTRKSSSLISYIVHVSYQPISVYVWMVKMYKIQSENILQRPILTYSLDNVNSPPCSCFIVHLPGWFLHFKHLSECLKIFHSFQYFFLLITHSFQLVSQARSILKYPFRPMRMWCQLDILPRIKYYSALDQFGSVRFISKSSYLSNGRHISILTVVDSKVIGQRYTITDPDLHSQVLNLPTSCHSTVSYQWFSIIAHNTSWPGVRYDWPIS